MANNLTLQIGKLTNPLRPSGFENASLDQIFSGIRDQIKQDVTGVVASGANGNVPQVSGGNDLGLKSLGHSISDLSRTISSVLGPLSGGSVSSVASGSSVPSISGGSVISSVVDAAKGGGWTSVLSAINPIAGLFGKLFGSGKQEAEPVLPTFVPNAPVQVEAAVSATSRGFTDVSYGADGLARRIPATPATQPAITVNVQAMDSRSFLDHSDDIARAVRSAMLTMNSINDVVGDL